VPFPSAGTTPAAAARLDPPTTREPVTTVTRDWRAPGPRDWKCEYNLAGTEVHVRPRNDLIWHPATTECPCGPSQHYVDMDGDVRWIVIHHALDGRPHEEGRYSPAAGPCDDDTDDDTDDDDGGGEVVRV
jgi:hypothetical protein